MVKIYYFSGTGNSFWTAKKISLDLGEPCELYNIGVEADKSETVIEADAVIFVFPSYGYGLPLVVRRFIKNAVIKTKYAAFFVTYGSSPKGTLGEARRLIKKKEIDKKFFLRVPSVENYIAMFGPPKEKTIQKRTAMQEEATEKALIAVKERRENKVNTFTPFSSFVSWLFGFGVKIFYKRYKVNTTCNGCALCEKLCPVNAIVIEESRPVFTKKCEHCQGCVNLCPLRAIKFARKKFGTAGYRHPRVELKDLTR